MSRTNQTEGAPAEASTRGNPDVVIMKTGRADKLSPRGEGSIAYQIGRVADDVYVRVAGNDSGGRHSKEWVPLASVRGAMTRAMLRGEPFKSTAMTGAFTGRSQNNSGFLVAALRAEGIFSQDEKHKGMSRLTGDVDAWEKAMREAEPPLTDGRPETMPLHPKAASTKFRPAGDAAPAGSSSEDGESAPIPPMRKRIRRPPAPKAEGKEPAADAESGGQPDGAETAIA